jgi:hypothetical protein
MTSSAVSPDTIQHINIKIFVEGRECAPYGEAIIVFHRWIKEAAMPEMLIDVADYAHVAGGPGVLLIGLEANYSLDDRESRLGLLYNRKAVLEGTFASRLEQAYEAALFACDRLEKEPEFAGKLKFNRNQIEFSVNDRLLAPNTEETWQALKPAITEFFPGATIARHGEPRDLFRVSVVRP